jgi:hypothetical protein
MACAVAWAVPAVAQDDRDAPHSLHSSISPAKGRLGERMTYEGSAVVRRGATPLKWLPPEEDPDVTWAPLRAHLSHGDAADTLRVETEIQIFRTGSVAVPGLRIQAQDPNQPTVWRLPVVTVGISSVLAAADSNADLRPMRGPLEAPWWERVPWLIALGVGLLAGLLTVLVMWWYKRRRSVEVLVPAPRTDPATTALERLAELRSRGLAARGRYAEHAFELTRILRRFLEATLATPRPGDTTASLYARLQNVGLTPPELESLMELLRYWDRVKFARVPTTAAEASTAEDAVEAFVRRHAPPPPAERVA